MQCPVCRCELPDHSKTCIRCGSQLSGMQEQPLPYTQDRNQSFGGKEDVSYNAKDNTASFAPGIRWRPVVVFAVIAIVLAVMYFLFIANKSINIEDYMTVEFEGYDTCGRVNATLDTEKLLIELRENLDNVEDVVLISGAIDWEFNQSEQLTNGDKITLSYKIDTKALEKYGIKIKAKDTEYEVTGLTPVQKLDPFQGLQMKFEGISPGISAYLDWGDTGDDDNMMDALDYELSKTEDIKIGDSITVTVSTNEEEFLDTYGYVLTSLSKDYICENQPAYLSASEELPEDSLESMKSQTEDVINSYFADKTEYMKQVGDLKYEGYYLLTSKKYQDYDANNIVYVVYSATIKSLDKSFAKQKVFIPVQFEDIIIDADGAAELNLDVNVIAYSTEIDFMSYIPGFQSQDKMYTELIATQKSSYNDEATGNLKS